MDNQKEQSTKILVFGIISIVPIILLFFIWLTLTLTFGWQNDGAAMFSLGMLVLSLFFLVPISVATSVLTMFFWTKRLKNSKNKKNIVGIVLSSISLSLIGCFILLLAISILPIW